MVHLIYPKPARSCTPASALCEIAHARMTFRTTHQRIIMGCRKTMCSVEQTLTWHLCPTCFFLLPIPEMKPDGSSFTVRAEPIARPKKIHCDRRRNPGNLDKTHGALPFLQAGYTTFSPRHGGCPNSREMHILASRIMDDPKRTTSPSNQHQCMYHLSARHIS